MRVAIFSESPSDEAAMRVLVGSLLGRELEPIPLKLRSRGWPAVKMELKSVLRELWVNQLADALVVSVDTDYAPVHAASDAPSDSSPCRQCVLGHIVQTTAAELRARHPELGFLAEVASASPAVEAWLLHGKPNSPTEATWKAFLLTSPSRWDVKTRVAELKSLVYGTPKPGETLSIEVAGTEARRVSQDLAGLSQSFPNGFGQMAVSVRQWNSTPGT